LSRLGTLLDVHNELLLALLELRALAVEFALRFCQRALMLAQTLRWRYCATEERFLRLKENKGSVHRRLWEWQYGMMISGEKRTTMFIQSNSNLEGIEAALAQRSNSSFFGLVRRTVSDSCDGLASHRCALFPLFLPQARPPTNPMSL